MKIKSTLKSALILFLSVGILSSFFKTNAIAQSVVSQPEYRVLYAHYDNVVHIGGTNGMANMTYKVSNADVSEDKTNGSFVVRPNDNASEVVFSFFNNADNKPINEVKFGVRKLPEPELLYRFGQQNLKIGYGPEFPLNSAKINYTVREWKLSIVGSKDETTKGNGPALSPQAMNIIRNAKKESSLMFEVQYEGAGVKNGLLRKSFNKESTDENDLLLTDEDLSEEPTIKVVEQLGMIALPEQRILYRNFDNILQIGSTDGQVLKVTAENVILSPKANNTYSARPNGEAKVGLIMVHSSNGVDTLHFKVKHLPAPTIFISNLNAFNSNPPEFADYQLSVGYPPETPLNPEYKITSWSISFNNDEKPFKGMGTRLPSELIQKMKKQEGDRKIIVTCNYEGNGKTAIVSTVFSY
jgi:hypothetical protein